MTVKGPSPRLPFICSECVEEMPSVVVGSLERNEVRGLVSRTITHGLALSWWKELKEDNVASAKGL